MLALTFANKEDYNKIQEDDTIDFTDLTGFAPDRPLTLVFNHKDGSKDTIKVNHTYNANQILWFKAGSALNQMGGKKTAAKPAGKKAGKKPAAKKKASKKPAGKKAAKNVKPSKKKTAKKKPSKKRRR
jgi:aconitate hydratase